MEGARRKNLLNENLKTRIEGGDNRVPPKESWDEGQKYHFDGDVVVDNVMVKGRVGVEVIADAKVRFISFFLHKTKFYFTRLPLTR